MSSSGAAEPKGAAFGSPPFSLVHADELAKAMVTLGTALFAAAWNTLVHSPRSTQSRYPYCVGPGYGLTDIRNHRNERQGIMARSEK